jgi:hypothetical protein
LVLSVPEPDISFHFLIQGLKLLKQVLKNRLQRLRLRPASDCRTGSVSQVI